MYIGFQFKGNFSFLLIFIISYRFQTLSNIIQQQLIRLTFLGEKEKLRKY